MNGFCKNPVEKDFLKDTGLDIMYDPDAKTNVLFQFVLDKTELDVHEREKMSDKLINHFNTKSHLPVIIYCIGDGHSKHVVCIRDHKEFAKLQKMYIEKMKAKRNGTIISRKEISYIKS